MCGANPPANKKGREEEDWQLGGGRIRLVEAICMVRLSCDVTYIHTYMHNNSIMHYDSPEESPGERGWERPSS